MFARLRETAKHTLVFGIGGGLQQAASYLLLPVYTRHLTPADYGVLNLLLVAGSLLSSISAAPVGAALFRSYYDYEAEQGRSLVVSTALFLVLGISGVLLLIGILFSRPLSVLLTGDPQYATLAVLVLLTSTLTSVKVVTLAVFRAQKWAGRYVIVSAGSLLVSLGLTIYLVVFRHLYIAGVVLGSLAGTIVSASISLWLIRHHIRLSISRLEVHKMLRYGLPLVPENLAGFGFNSADRLVIQAFLGPSAVGLYALGRRFGQIVRLLVIQPYSLAEAPAILSAERDPQAKGFYARLLTYYLLVTAFVSVAISLLAEDVLRIISDQAYWGATTIVPWLCLASVLYGMRNLIGVGLGLKRRTYWFPIALGAGALVYWPLMMVSVPTMGIGGAALSLVIAYCIMCVVRYFAGQRVYPMRFETARLVKLLIASCATLLLGNAIVMDSVWLSLVLKGTVVILGMPAVLLGLRFVDKTETEHLRRVGLYLREVTVRKGAISR
jgi:O-antigen/teichoic acid export membrane protein